jgi:predicted RNA-binding Zn-ribbon protein involved in translation (DUF1610 family)
MQLEIQDISVPCLACHEVRKLKGFVCPNCKKIITLDESKCQKGAPNFCPGCGYDLQS